MRKRRRRVAFRAGSAIREEIRITVAALRADMTLQARTMCDQLSILHWSATAAAISSLVGSSRCEFPFGRGGFARGPKSYGEEEK